MGSVRRCARIVLAVLLALVAAICPAAPAVAAEAQFVLSTSPDGPSTKIVRVPFRTKDTQAIATFFLRAAPGADPSGLLSTTAPAGVSVTLAHPAGQAGGATLAVDATAGASVDVAATVVWDSYGTADVPLLMRVGTAITEVGMLHLHRPGGPPLRVVGATDSGLTLPSSGPVLKSAATVATGDRAAAKVVARISPFLDATSGRLYQPDHPKVSLGNMAANATRSVPLRAALPYSGAFTATLSLAHDGIVDPPVALTINRTLAPSGVTIDAVQVSSSAFWPLRGRPQVTRALVLNETVGRKARVWAPVLVKPSAAVEGSTGNEADVRVGSIVVSPSQAGCRKVADPRATDHGRTAAPTHAIVIDAGQSCRVEVTLELPPKPGQYEGTLRFAQPGAQALEAPLTVQLRRSLGVAAAFIGLGLLLGFLIKVVLRGRRTRLERLAKVARTGQELDQRVAALPLGFRDDTEKTTYEHLRQRLASVAAEAGGDTPDDSEFADRLDTIRVLISVLVPWVILRRAVLDAPDQIREALKDDVDEIRMELETETDKATAGGLSAKLDELKTKLQAQQLAMVTRELNRLKAEVTEWLAPDVRGPIVDQLDAAVALVSAEGGSPEQARRELALAQQTAARAMSARIEDLLDSAPPAGMDSGAWAQLQAGVRAILSGVGTKPPDAALEAVREADERLLRGLVDAIHTQVSSKLETLKGTEAPAAAPQVAALEKILNQLEEARAALLRGDLGAAHTAFDDARTGLDGARIAGFLGVADPVTTAPKLPRAPDAPTSTAFAVPNPVVIPLPDLPGVRKGWKRYELALMIVTLLVGVILGLLALYVGKPTWGSTGDILLALLWGAGLYQAPGAIQQGYSGVRTALDT